MEQERILTDMGQDAIQLATLGFGDLIEYIFDILVEKGIISKEEVDIRITEIMLKAEQGSQDFDKKYNLVEY